MLHLRRLCCLQVESLVGRSPISAAALGHHHSLFLDQGEQQQQQACTVLCNSGAR
jgi:hypothetical protein